MDWEWRNNDTMFTYDVIIDGDKWKNSKNSDKL